MPTGEEAILTDGTAPTNTQMGYSVAVDQFGDRVVVGAVGGTANRGSIYVFLRTGSTWTQEVVLSGYLQDQGASGTSVACDATCTRIAVGCPGVQAGGANANGVIMVFLRNGTSWTTEINNLSITYSGYGNAAQLGKSVSMSADGSRIVAGGYTYSPSSTLGNQGCIQFWDRSGTTWTASGGPKTITLGAGANEYMGWAVAISADGTWALSGHYGYASNTGYAVSWQRSGGDWVQRGALGRASATQNDGFGFSVALSYDGTTAVIGTPYRTIAGAINAGSAYVFTRSGTNWTEGQLLVLTDKATTDYFGNSVAINADGTRIIGGTPGRNSKGLISIWNLVSGTWTESTDRAIPSPTGVVNLGYSVALVSAVSSTSRIVGGSQQYNSARGGAFVFS